MPRRGILALILVDPLIALNPHIAFFQAQTRHAAAGPRLGYYNVRSSHLAKGPEGQNQGAPKGFQRAILSLEGVPRVLRGGAKGPAGHPGPLGLAALVLAVELECDESKARTHNRVCRPATICSTGSAKPT